MMTQVSSKITIHAPTDGRTIIERLEALDEETQWLSYALLTDTPFGNCVTTMTVRELGLNQAELTWSATFTADGLPEREATDLLKGALSTPNDFQINQRVRYRERHYRRLLCENGQGHVDLLSRSYFASNLIFNCISSRFQIIECLKVHP